MTNLELATRRNQQDSSVIKAPQLKTLVASAQKISREISSKATEAESNRKISDDIIAMISDAEIYQMLVPKKYGGLEMSISDYIEVILALSPLDASAGWTTSFYIGHNWMWNLLPEQAQQEIFADGPSARGPVMVAPTVVATPKSDGFVLNGRAKWGTGSAHAQWCMVGGVVASDKAGPPDIRMFAMPWREARIEDTWHTSGMAATASHDVIFEDVFIPAHRMMKVADVKAGSPPGATLHENSLYYTPFTPFLCLIASAPLVAVARGISQHAIARAKEFVSSYSGKTSADNPALQIRLAKADLMSRAAETLLRDLASELEEGGKRAPVPIEERVVMRAKASYIATVARDTATLLSQGGGASAQMKDSPLQRAMRDLNMASCHVVFDQDPTMELHGKMLVGMPPDMILA
ncbi:MAG: acyl-CoA dehydrogenase family protein [Henriciella sp.]